MIYWLIFLTWVLYAYFIKKGSQHHLLIAFSLFLLAAILKIFTLDKFAQSVMSVSLLGWLIGITIAILEYKQNKLIETHA